MARPGRRAATPLKPVGRHRVVVRDPFASTITAASSVLDRRRTYGLLRLAGTPLRVLDAARREETLVPVAVLAGGAVLTGIFTAAPLTILGGSSSLDMGGIALLAGCFGLGVGGLIAASALSRPLLRTVTEQAGPRAE
ncbi:hypothetical protein [Streptomyces sp. NL15-2K]|uniref:hypothetical protein n=1 Tax=Streptomyces sp. NL15-2K TaxID=376149 RepID=UPI000F56BB84|nr:MULTISPECIES: hypothetical protein [Actinomycetes]WKX11122.1 hypothetical protein Q4V64_27865 [Kutzneria buriramensis]GCB47448.1 hypothetical protein SNL152K_4753 [Streptomyces sp. NL15-2K]